MNLARVAPAEQSDFKEDQTEETKQISETLENIQGHREIQTQLDFSVKSLEDVFSDFDSTLNSKQRFSFCTSTERKYFSEFANEDSFGSIDVAAERVKPVWRQRPQSPVRRMMPNDFQSLPSSRQNEELFRILTAISNEIQSLKRSTERKFQAIEEMLTPKSSPVKVIKEDKQGDEMKDGRERWNKIRLNRSYNRYKNMAGPMVTSSNHSYDLNVSSDQEDNNENEIDRSKSPTWPTLTQLEYLTHKAKTANETVILNVGGTRYEATWALLERLPQTRLGKLRSCRTEEEVLKLCDGFDPDKNEYKFCRQPRNFSCVLNFLTTGKLHLGEETCVIAFSQDMEYWGIDDLYLEPCCVQRYYQQRELLNWDYQLKKEEENEEFPSGKIGKVQKIVWDLFEKPHTSLGARIVAIISIAFIIISTVVLTLNTLPYFSSKNNKDDEEKDFPPFALLEAVYMSWFTFEFVVRFLSSPSKLKFIKSPMNVIDLLAILPYFASIALVNTTDVHQLTEVRRIAQFFRIMRILRIFKLARHSVGLQSLGFTVRNSYKELGLLMLFLTMGVLIFSSLAYVFEKDDGDSSFETMMDAYWWALITMTTVGYGDISPTTGLGKVIGSCCAIAGVLVIALPIPIIGNNFAAFYKNERRREQLAEKKLAIERARRKGAIQPFPGQHGFPLDDISDKREDESTSEKVTVHTNSNRPQSVEIAEIGSGLQKLSEDLKMSSHKLSNGSLVKKDTDKSMSPVSIR